MILIEVEGDCMDSNLFSINITINLCAFLFYLFLFVVYFHKNANYNIRNLIFRRILIIGIFTFLFELTYLLLVHFSSSLLLIGLSKKFMSLSLLYSLLFWTYYVVILVYEKNKEQSNSIRKNHNTIDLYLLLIAFTIGVITIVLPIDYSYAAEGVVKAVSGPCFIFIMILSILLLLIPLPLIVRQREIVMQKRMFSYYVICIFIILSLIFIHIYSAVSFLFFVFTLSCYLIYYRLENPDLLYVRKFKRNQERLRTLREKYGFLFNMSPELRDLLNEISFMKENYVTENKKTVSYKKLETLIQDFIRSSEGGITTQTNIDDDGIEILELEEDEPDEMLLTKEIYSLQELKEVLKEDNLPKW